MASKKDLEARIDELEAEIAQLRIQVAQKQQPVVLPQPAYPYHPYGWYPGYTGQVWCSTSTSLKGTMNINSDDGLIAL